MSQHLHLRAWRGRTAVDACRPVSTGGTTTPNPAKVTCTACRAIIKAESRNA